MRIMITGGAGFIGSALIRMVINRTNHVVLNIDKLTYSGNLASLQGITSSTRYSFSRTDICDGNSVRVLMKEFQPEAVVHLAAESHVDRSIDSSSEFISTNIQGTYSLLEACRGYWEELKAPEKTNFRFLHVSTDEVYGTLGETGLFTEETAYDPRSPYSSSKASSDHLVRAWFHTYGLPTLITNCSNNYGPYQYPEKLIPVVIVKALRGEGIPVYGTGVNVRDWLYVDDHVGALLKVLESGKPGETYNIGGQNEKRNIDVVKTICDTLDILASKSDGSSYKEQITFVSDRPGHDYRYAIDASKIETELGWQPLETFESGIDKTVRWYMNNRSWCNNVINKFYNLERLGSV